MEAERVIEVKNLKKSFKVFYDKGSSLKEKILFQKRNRYEERWVLNGIDFSVNRGEAVALIGKNGCGKSTTLKLLTKIIYPTEGSVKIKGRVSSLLELGAGFHPDMSGRENIYTNAAIFGLTRKEIDRRLNDIIEFSELEEFIDNPVRTYSSGMYMRLAFSVAINVDADVLLIDEILAVGDVSFQAKCMERLREIKKQGTTIVLVSHSTGQIEQICDRVIWIEDGKIKEEGIPKFVNDRYLASMEEKRLLKKEESKLKEIIAPTLESMVMDPVYSDRAVRSGNRDIEIANILLTDAEGMRKTVFKTEDSIMVSIFYKNRKDIEEANFTIGIARDDGVYCYGSSVILDSNFSAPIQGSGVVRITLLKNTLLTGKYFLDIGIQSSEGEMYDAVCSALEFHVMNTPIKEYGILSLQHIWEVDGVQISNK